MDSAEPTLVSVALPIGLRQVFTYAVPPGLREQIRVGHRVRVPFGPRRMHGYVVAIAAKAPRASLRSIELLEPEEPLFDRDILDLTRWVSAYYLSPWGQVLEAALPPGVRSGSGSGRRRRDSATAAAPVMDADHTPHSSRNGDEEQARPSAAGAGRVTLLPEQGEAVTLITGALSQDAYTGFLLLGVTDSGKTEVYLEAAEAAVQSGGQVLFLVPEIALGTQILKRIEERFAGQVGLYHSMAGEPARRRIWREARDGRLPVVVGTRSAVFVPMKRLRLVIVDEEHEWAYKQDEAPRYHGRDVAVMRARLCGATAVLGSATPSLESFRNGMTGKYRLMRLSRRAADRPPSEVRVVDLRGDEPREVRGGRMTRQRTIFTPQLLEAIQLRLRRREQAILFLNRRGHSPVVQCSDCGALVQCRSCDVVMSWHKSGGTLRCHYCNALRTELGECPGCGGVRYYFGGVGTQKVEELLAEHFPLARLARMDMDTMRRRGAHARLIQAMEKGEIDLLLGTQMVTKGLHFPRVTLVGVLQAEREMMQPDFRASERAFQILTQVAGRSGRGCSPGEVLMQSLMPDHPVMEFAASQDYDAFAAQELDARRALEYPPFSRMIDLLVDGTKEEQVEKRAGALLRFLEQKRRIDGLSGVEILGPAPMPHARLRGRYRRHLTLKGSSSAAVHAMAAAALEFPAPAGLSGTRIQVDVDPLGMS